MDSLWYDIDGTPVDDPLTFARMWAARREDPEGEWRIGHDLIGEVEVSTVWTGYDMGLGLSEAPLIFETEVFGGVFDHEVRRYATREQAAEGHAYWVGLIQAELALAST